MITIYPSETRFKADQGWLKSNFSFSFGPYYDSDNTSFGPMRVLNDDYVASTKGFGAHPHSDMEIVSIVLKGKLRHEDSLGNAGTTAWGEIQRMTAGTGIVHTEFSASEDEELNLLQMWFTPEKRGLDPSYEITDFDVNALDGQWLPVVSKQALEHIAKIHQDMTIYLRKLGNHQEAVFETPEDRRIFLFVIEGGLTFNKDYTLNVRDSARIEGESKLEITADADSLIMLIDLP